MAFVYTRSQLLSDINGGIRGKILMIASQEDFANRVAREVNNDIALRSAKRKSDLAPDLFPGILQYACPADLRDNRIIDIPAQAKRQDGSFNLVPSVQFATNREKGDISLEDYNGVRTLLIDSNVYAPSTVISPLENTTSGGGTWALVGDAVNVDDDGDDFIKGNGSVSFDIGVAGLTTAGLQNDDLDIFDITDYLDGRSSVFVWVKIADTDDITNFVLQLGSSTSDYYSKTVTARHDGNAFQVGWNLLRFPLASLSTTGSPINAAMNYASCYMTKAVGKINQTGYKMNWMAMMRGTIHQVYYYSKYPWVTSAGAYIQNSTDASDLLVADESEYELFVLRGVSRGMRHTNFNLDDIKDADDEYSRALAKYGSENPDESMLTITEYHEQ